MPGVSLFLLATLLTFADQPQLNQDPQQANPSASQSSSAQPQATPAQQEQQKSDANQRIQSSLADLLSSDPVLNGTDVDVAVDDSAITLSGKVDSYAQHQRVLQLAAQYGRYRKIVDNVQMK